MSAPAPRASQSGNRRDSQKRGSQIKLKGLDPNMIIKHKSIRLIEEQPLVEED